MTKVKYNPLFWHDYQRWILEKETISCAISIAMNCFVFLWCTYSATLGPKKRENDLVSVNKFKSNNPSLMIIFFGDDSLFIAAGPWWLVREWGDRFGHPRRQCLFRTDGYDGVQFTGHIFAVRRCGLNQWPLGHQVGTFRRGISKATHPIIRKMKTSVFCNRYTTKVCASCSWQCPGTYSSLLNRSLGRYSSLG